MAMKKPKTEDEHPLASHWAKSPKTADEYMYVNAAPTPPSQHVLASEPAGNGLCGSGSGSSQALLTIIHSFVKVITGAKSYGDGQVTTGAGGGY